MQDSNATPNEMIPPDFPTNVPLKYTCNTPGTTKDKISLTVDDKQVKTGYGQVDWLTESDLIQDMVATCSTDNNSELLYDVLFPPTPIGEIRRAGKVNNNDPLTEEHPHFIYTQFMANPKPSVKWRQSGLQKDSVHDLQVLETNEAGHYNIDLGIKHPTDDDLTNEHFLEVTNEMGTYDFRVPPSVMNMELQPSVSNTSAMVWASGVLAAFVVGIFIGKHFKRFYKWAREKIAAGDEGDKVDGLSQVLATPQRERQDSGTESNAD